MQNHPPRGQKQRSRNKRRHHRFIHNPCQILNPHRQTRPPLHLRSHLPKQLPECIKRYFTDVYLFCLHKDPNDTTKLRPLGIPTAIRRLIASHVARTLRDKFSSHLLPYNYAVGVPNGSDFVVKAMQLSIEKFIDHPQRTNKLPTRAAVFFDLTNQFNSVSREEFFNVIETSFPDSSPSPNSSTTRQTQSTINGTMEHGAHYSWKKVSVEDAHSHPSLLPLLLHDLSNQLTHSYANEQQHD